MSKKVTDYIHELKQSFYDDKKGWIKFLIGISILIYSAYVCSSCGGYYKFTDQYGNEIPKEFLIQIVRSYNEKMYGNLTIPNITFLTPNQTQNNTQD